MALHNSLHWYLHELHPHIHRPCPTAYGKEETAADIKIQLDGGQQEGFLILSTHFALFPHSMISNSTDLRTATTGDHHILSALPHLDQTNCGWSLADIRLQSADLPPKAHLRPSQVSLFSDPPMIVEILARHTPTSNGRTSEVILVKKLGTGTQCSGMTSRRKWEKCSKKSFPNNLSDKAEAHSTV